MRLSAFRVWRIFSSHDPLTHSQQSCSQIFTHRQSQQSGTICHASRLNAYVRSIAQPSCSRHINAYTHAETRSWAFRPSKLLITMCYKVNARRFGIPYRRKVERSEGYDAKEKSRESRESITTPASVCLVSCLSKTAGLIA